MLFARAIFFKFRYLYNLLLSGPDLAPRQDEAGPHLTFQTPRQDGAGGPPHLRWGKERAHATP